jgi:hypothetical protein
MSWLERHRVGYVFGLAGNRILMDRVAGLCDAVAVRRAEENVDRVRRFGDLVYAARSWKSERRVIARVEATRLGGDTRFIVTNLSGAPHWLYEDLYCGRGQAENLIKAHKLHLASDRTSYSLSTASRRCILSATKRENAMTMNWHLTKMGAVALVLGLGATIAAPSPRAEEPIQAAVLTTYFQNDHAEWVPTTDAERHRMTAMVDTFKSMLEASGRYKFKAVDQSVQDRIGKDQKMGECGGCETVYGKELGVAQVAWIEVQKVSELILNVNVYIADANTGQKVFVKSVDLRGNNDDSWQHAIKFLVKRYMLRPEQETSQPGGKP